MKKNYSFRFFCIILSMAFGLSASAGIIYVKPNAESTAWSTQETVYEDFTTAYSAAASNDEIWLAAGEYPVAGTHGYKSVKIYGGFEGTETSIAQRAKVANGRTWDFANASTIKLTVSLTNSGIFNGGGGAYTFALDGITLDGSREDGITGRAVNITSNNASCRVSITNCIVQNFSSNHDGGAFNTRSTGVVISNCLIQNNSGTKGGGGYFEQAVISFCDIINNSVIPTAAVVDYQGSGNGAGGGVLLASAGTTAMYNCYIAGNAAEFGGGAFVRANASVYNCIIVDNTTTKSGSGVSFEGRDNGGSVYNCIIANNKSELAGGAGVCFVSTNAGEKKQSLSNSILYNNVDSGDAVSNIAAISTSGSVAPVITNNILDAATSYDDAQTVIETNPARLFRNIDSGDYVPVGLVGRDQGADGLTFAGNIDYAGGSRVQGGSVDIGPYELITIGYIGAGADASDISVTLNGNPITTFEEGFFAVYGDKLEISFKKTGEIPACNIPEAIVAATGNSCTATIIVVESYDYIEVSSATARTITVNYPATSQISSPAGDEPFAVANGSTFLLTIINQEGYESEAKIGTEPLTLTSLGNWSYTLTIENVSEDITIDITNTIKTYELSVSTDGATLSETPPAAINHGEAYTLSFALASDHHMPHIYINGALQTVSQSGEAYSIEIASVKEAKTVVIVAWPANQIPVMYDGTAMSNNTGTIIQLGRPGNSGRFGLWKFDMINAPANYDKISLKLTVASFDEEYPEEGLEQRLSWRSNYLCVVNGTTRDDNAEGPNLWTESNMNWNGTSATSTRPATKDGFTGVDVTISQSMTEAIYDITGDNLTLLKEFVAGAEGGNKALSFMIANIDGGALASVFLHSREGALAAQDKSLWPVLVFSTGTTNVDSPEINDPIVSKKYYTLQGIEIAQPIAGSMNVVKYIYQSGKSDAKVEYISK